MHIPLVVSEPGMHKVWMQVHNFILFMKQKSPKGQTSDAMLESEASSVCRGGRALSCEAQFVLFSSFRDYFEYGSIFGGLFRVNRLRRSVFNL